MALEAGQPLAVIAPLLGHSSTIITARYAHLSERYLLDASNATAAKLTSRRACQGAALRAARAQRLISGLSATIKSARFHGCPSRGA
jgi:hypothetical protein